MKSKDGSDLNIVDFLIVGFIVIFGVPLGLLCLPVVAVGWMFCKAREAMAR